LNLRKENKDITIIVSSHNLDEVSNFCDWVIHLKNSKVLCSKEFNKEKESLRKYYLQTR
jgi:ABC-type multidrug transport system ATPase subunit